MNGTESFTFTTDFPQKATYELAIDEDITTGEEILSTNEEYRLVLQSDGNLVLYDIVNSGAEWASGTSGQGGEAKGEGFTIYPTELQSLPNHILNNSIDGIVHMSGDVHQNVLRFNDNSSQNWGYNVYDFISSGIGRDNNKGKWAKVEVDTTISDPTFKITYYEKGTNAFSWGPSNPKHFIPVVKSYTVKLSQLQN